MRKCDVVLVFMYAMDYNKRTNRGYDMTEQFVVCNWNAAGELVGLRGTVFAMSMDRAIRYDALTDAIAARSAAAKFHPKRMYAKTVILKSIDGGAPSNRGYDMTKQETKAQKIAAVTKKVADAINKIDIWSNTIGSAEEQGDFATHYRAKAAVMEGYIILTELGIETIVSRYYRDIEAMQAMRAEYIRNAQHVDTVATYRNWQNDAIPVDDHDIAVAKASEIEKAYIETSEIVGKAS